MSTYAEKKELNNCNCSTPHGTDSVLSSHHNSTISVSKSQCLQPKQKIENEVNDKFTLHKKDSELLVDSYVRLGFDRKADLVANCASYLEFALYQDETIKLHRAYFCRDRLCPMCAWRRSRKIFGQVSQIMDVIEKDYEFIFLTLTVPNVPGDELSKTIDSLGKGWAKFIKYKRISKICKGFFKALEVTYSRKRDDYHPHFHVIIAVPKKYFKGADYIKRDEWLDLWRKAMQNPDIIMVDVRRVRPKDFNSSGINFSEIKSVKKAVAEVAKYAVKSVDYLFKNSTRQTDFCVYTFSDALKNRRLCAFGGCFQEVHEKLLLDDAENGDLIHTDCQLRSDVLLMLYKYKWNCGAFELFEIEDKALDYENILAECDE